MLGSASAVSNEGTKGAICVRLNALGSCDDVANNKNVAHHTTKQQTHGKTKSASGGTFFPGCGRIGPTTAQGHRNHNAHHPRRTPYTHTHPSHYTLVTYTHAHSVSRSHKMCGRHQPEPSAGGSSKTHTANMVYTRIETQTRTSDNKIQHQTTAALQRSVACRAQRLAKPTA